MRAVCEAKQSQGNGIIILQIEHLDSQLSELFWMAALNFEMKIEEQMEINSIVGVRSDTSKNS